MASANLGCSTKAFVREGWRHPDVDDRDVRLVTSYVEEEFVGVAATPDNTDTAELEQRRDRVAEKRLILRDDCTRRRDRVRHGVDSPWMSEAAEPERLAALVEAMLASSLDAVVTIDASGRVLMFNRAAEDVFGYAADDALGRDVAELIIPPALRQRHYAALARHLETGERTILGRRVELEGMRSDGAEFPVELTVTHVPIDGPPIFTAYLRDITERKRAENELLESRARIVQAADDERRRIERNLHDGAQQRLLTIGVLLRRVAMEEPASPGLRELVELAQRETGVAIEELRELARGIHPASLTESGLPTALRGLAREALLDVTAEIADVRLPESLEVAFYYVAAEALANVVKHSNAGHALVSLTVADGVATLRVADNGVGGADRGGSGLTGLVDRLEAIGATLTVESASGIGTTVTAVAPVA